MNNDHFEFFLTASAMTPTRAKNIKESSPTMHLSHYNAFAKYVIFFLAFCRVEDVSFTLSFIRSSCSIWAVNSRLIWAANYIPFSTILFISVIASLVRDWASSPFWNICCNAFCLFSSDDWIILDFLSPYENDYPLSRF